MENTRNNDRKIKRKTNKSVHKKGKKDEERKISMKNYNIDNEERKKHRK